MSENSELATYQDALQQLLLLGESAESIIEAMKTDPRFEPFRSYVDSFDLDMIAVASELMQVWSVRKESEEEYEEGIVGDGPV